MKENRYVIGLDEGTTSARAVVFDIVRKEIVSIQSQTFKQFYPHNGWVEQDPEEIYLALLFAFQKAVSEKRIDKEKIFAVGLTAQRETVVAFNKETGLPIYNAIVWQCRRTAKDIENLPESVKEKIRLKTGLVPDAYFSASKMAWIMKNVPEAKKLAKEKKLGIGTIDSFITYKLTGRFATDTSNASRTMLYNINTMDWDDELLSFWGIDKSVLPEVLPSACEVGTCKDMLNLPLCSIIGDQQASLVGHGALKAGKSKITFGTGGFLLVNTGNRPNLSNKKLLSTVAWTVNGKTAYALEGSIFSACSAINWAGKSAKLFDRVEDTEKMALSVPDNGGVYFVPAFTGLGSPYWNSEARACFVGLTFQSNKNHMVRAVLESLGFGANAILEAMEKSKIKLGEISVDGGGSKNAFILQFLSDVSQKAVYKAESSECSVLGAIYLACVAKQIIKFEDIENLSAKSKQFVPSISKKDKEKLVRGWENAVLQSCGGING